MRSGVAVTAVTIALGLFFLGMAWASRRGL